MYYIIMTAFAVTLGVGGWGGDTSLHHAALFASGLFAGHLVTEGLNAPAN